MPPDLLLPEEIIIHEVLIRLPIKPLVRCRCVCKSSNSKFYNPDFLSHFNRSISLNPKSDDDGDDDYHILMNSYNKHVSYVFMKNHKNEDDNDDYYCLSILSRKQLSETHIIDNYVPYPTLSLSSYSVDLVGSINGLVCLAFQFRHEHDQFVLWNPTIGFSKKIIVPKHLGDIGFPPLLYGFGWDSATNDYTLIIKSIQAYTVSPAGVYSCKTDCWRIIENLRCPNLDVTHFSKLPSVIINGSPYWDYWAGYHILKFDTTSNEFKYLDLPSDDCFRYNVINLNDCLALITNDKWSGRRGVVYSFDEEHNIWTKMYTIIDYKGMNLHDMEVYCFKSSGEIVFHENKNLHLYDPKSREIKSHHRKPNKHRFHDCGGFLVNGFSYTPSLLFLQGMKALHM